MRLRSEPPRPRLLCCPGATHCSSGSRGGRSGGSSAGDTYHSLSRQAPPPIGMPWSSARFA